MALDRRHSMLFNPAISFLILALLMSNLPGAATAWGAIAESCEKALDQAEESYRLGKLDEAIEQANGCLTEGNPSSQDGERAYLLLAKAYHAKGLPEKAKESIEDLMRFDPNWKPNPEMDTPSFRSMAEEVMEEMGHAETVETPAEEKPAEVATGAGSETTPEHVQPLPHSGGSKKFLWLGIGAAAIGGGLAIALSGGGGDSGPTPLERLPDAPGAPGSN